MRDDEVAAVPPRSIGTGAVAAARGGVVGSEPEMNQGVAMGVGDERNRSAFAAVAAIGTAARNEFFPAKTEAAATAVAGLDVDVDFVDEHRRSEIREQTSGIRHQGIGKGADSCFLTH